MAHARRAHARSREPVVQPRGRAIAEIGADGLMHRAEDLEQDEYGARKRERTREAAAPLNGADEDAHRDAKDRREDASQHERDPPDPRQRTIGPRQDAEERPFLAAPQALDHERNDT